MKLKHYVFLYVGVSVIGWFTDEIFGVVRFLGSYCEETRLHNITLTNEGNCSNPHIANQIMHDTKPSNIEHFNKRMHTLVKNRNLDEVDIPVMAELQGLSHVALWRSGKRPRASAWNDTVVVEGPSWEPPRQVTDYEMLKGDYVVHFSWFEGNFGHLFDDSLTQISFIRNQVPKETKWILCDTPLMRSVLQFLDPEFASRIHWVKMGLPISVEGNLKVVIQPAIPNFAGCCRPYDHLRQWVSEKHPDVPTDKKIVYYSRDSSDTHHLRKVEKHHELEILDRIRQGMIRHNIKEDLVIFNGQDEEGKTLPIAEQFAVFRSARTIIGPHGAGMLGNILWTNPLPETCASRTNIIEFIPGVNSTKVQPLYRSLFIRWRKWPLDFHVLLFTPESTKEETFIDLNMLDEALDDTWGSLGVPEIKDQ